jgi:hypothetical protein
VAHARPPAPPPLAALPRVILRDGSVLSAKELPKLVGGTVRFADPHGTLVSVRASEVDLAATAAANHMTWTAPAPAAAPAAVPPKVAASRPAKPPHQ